MKTKLVILAIVIIVLGGGWYYYTNYEDPSISNLGIYSNNKLGLSFELPPSYYELPHDIYWGELKYTAFKENEKKYPNEFFFGIQPENYDTLYSHNQLIGTVQINGREALFYEGGQSPVELAIKRKDGRFLSILNLDPRVVADKKILDTILLEDSKY